MLAVHSAATKLAASSSTAYCLQKVGKPDCQHSPLYGIRQGQEKKYKKLAQRLTAH